MLSWDSSALRTSTYSSSTRHLRTWRGDRDPNLQAGAASTSGAEGRIEVVTSHQWPVVSYKVESSDGTGAVTLRFLGRRGLPGFEPGRWLSVAGTPAEIHGRLVILNPLYSFLPDEPLPI